jgi:hypothetical protein
VVLSLSLLNMYWRSVVDVDRCFMLVVRWQYQFCWKLVLGDAKWLCRSEVDRVTDYGSDTQIFVIFTPRPFLQLLFTFLGS